MVETQGMSQGQDVSSSSPVVSTPSEGANGSPSPAEDRKFSQADVNDIVGRAKHEAVERYKRANDAVDRREPSRDPQQSYFNPDERYRQIAAEEAKRHFDAVRQDAIEQSQRDLAQRTVNNFYTKTISTGKEKYQDFEKVTGDIDYQRYPNIIQLMADYVDNPQDVYYELGKDRIKMATLEMLAEKSPADAIKAAQALSSSLKMNEDANRVRVPNEPLSKLSPSNTGTDSGVMSVSDYRKKYKI